jgi:hypothetical protein
VVVYLVVIVIFIAIIIFFVYYLFIIIIISIIITNINIGSNNVVPLIIYKRRSLSYCIETKNDNMQDNYA